MPDDFLTCPHCGHEGPEAEFFWPLELGKRCPKCGKKMEREEEE